jgi:hypothetical protein
MGCETLLENFFRISGMFFWAVAVIAAFIIWKQKEQIKGMMGAKRAADDLKELLGGNREEEIQDPKKM